MDLMVASKRESGREDSGGKEDDKKSLFTKERKERRECLKNGNSREAS